MITNKWWLLLFWEYIISFLAILTYQTLPVTTWGTPVNLREVNYLLWNVTVSWSHPLKPFRACESVKRDWLTDSQQLYNLSVTECIYLIYLTHLFIRHDMFIALYQYIFRINLICHCWQCRNYILDGLSIMWYIHIYIYIYIYIYI